MIVGSNSKASLWDHKQEKNEPPFMMDGNLHDQVIQDRYLHTRGSEWETQDSTCSLHWTRGGDYFYGEHFLLKKKKNHYKFTNQDLSLSFGQQFSYYFFFLLPVPEIPSFFSFLPYSHSVLVGLPKKGPRRILETRWYLAISGKPYEALWTSSGCLG